jgi:hypothetical protein
MGKKLRSFYVIVLLVFLFGITGISSAQDNKSSIASASSPGLVKKKVNQSIEVISKQIEAVEKKLAAPNLSGEDKPGLEKSKKSLEAALANLKNPKSNTVGLLGLVGAPLSGSSHLPVGVSVGHLGRVDLFHSGCLRRHYGRCRPYHHLWPG